MIKGCSEILLSPYGLLSGNRLSEFDLDRFDLVSFNNEDTETLADAQFVLQKFADFPLAVIEPELVRREDRFFGEIYTRINNVVTIESFKGTGLLAAVYQQALTSAFEPVAPELKWLTVRRIVEKNSDNTSMVTEHLAMALDTIYWRSRVSGSSELHDVVAMKAYNEGIQAYLLTRPYLS